MQQDSNLEALEDKAVDMQGNLCLKLPVGILKDFLTYSKLIERIGKTKGYKEGFQDGYKHGIIQK